MKGQPHRQKPDTDNLTKALKDALWQEDSGIWKECAEKRWDDGKGPRVEVRVGVAPRNSSAALLISNSFIPIEPFHQHK